MSQARILVCDDEAGLREMLSVLFRRAGYAVDVVDAVSVALARIRESDPYDVVITDLLLPDGSGMDVLAASRAREDSTQVVMITAYATTEQAVAAMREGAYDYVQKPFRNDALRATVEKALEKRGILVENRLLRAERIGAFRLGDVVGKSAAMQHILDLVRRVADAPTSVFVTGESGTGKEMVARALHFTGARRDHAFVAVNCGALPESLMESELFGHEKGAFTGAQSKKEGLFRAAHGGTLFLDEIGELPLALQVKLLRVLQERRVRPVGASAEIEVDVRVIAATNRDIAEEVESGRFRQDLYYRLNVIHIHVPPLRERPEDIPILAQHFLDKHGALQGKHLALTPEALRYLTQAPFPGNVRELENAIERAVTLAATDRIGIEDLSPSAPRARDSRPTPLVAIPEEGFDLDRYLGEVERDVLLRALEKANGVRVRAAKLVGMTFRSFRYRLAKYGIDGTEGEESESEDV